MDIINTSRTLLADVNRLKEEKRDVAAEIPIGEFLRGLPHGYEHKVLFVANGEMPGARLATCMALTAFIQERGLEIKVWHDLSHEAGCLIMDPPTTRQLRQLQEFQAD